MLSLSLLQMCSVGAQLFFKKCFVTLGLVWSVQFWHQHGGRVFFLCSIIKFYVTNKIVEHSVRLRPAQITAPCVCGGRDVPQF